MNLYLLALRIHVPGWLARRKVQELFEATASACGTVPPDLKGLSLEQRLEQYALFTRDEIGRKIRGGEDMQQLKEILHRHACRLGTEIRTRLRLRSTEDVLSAGRVLYRTIGIDFEGDTSGAVVIRRCYFSRFYDAAICSVMSALDSGIAAGLTAGKELRFTRRITEGSPTCEAILDGSGEGS